MKINDYSQMLYVLLTEKILLFQFFLVLLQYTILKYIKYEELFIDYIGP